MQKKEIVNFIGIGVPKAATTWIYKCLSEHPDICMSDNKEVDFFFGENFTKGLVWYKNRFKHCKSGHVKGEYSPNYIYHPEAADRIKKDFPNTKLIVCLRNPIERFLSEHYFWYGMGRHDNKDIASIPEKRKERMLVRGLYAKHLRPYFDLFPREQILVLQYEDIEKGPIDFVKNMYSFLGVSDGFVPAGLLSRENVTSTNRTKIRWIKKLYYFVYRKISRNSFSKFLVPVFKWSGIAWMFRHIVLWNDRGGKESGEKKRISDTERAELKKYYKEDIRLLSNLTGLDLSMWK